MRRKKREFDISIHSLSSFKADYVYAASRRSHIFRQFYFSAYVHSVVHNIFMSRLNGMNRANNKAAIDILCELLSLAPQYVVPARKEIVNTLHR